MKEGSDFFMNLALFTKDFSRCALSSSSFAKKTFLYVKEACKYTYKENYIAMYKSK